MKKRISRKFYNQRARRKLSPFYYVLIEQEGENSYTISYHWNFFSKIFSIVCSPIIILGHMGYGLIAGFKNAVSEITVPFRPGKADGQIRINKEVTYEHRRFHRERTKIG